MTVQKQLTILNQNIQELQAAAKSMESLPECESHAKEIQQVNALIDVVLMRLAQ